MSRVMHSSLRPGEINLDLIPNDWPLTPLNGHKAPYITGWQNKPYSIKEIENEILTGQCKAIGLLSGPVFNKPLGLIWLDIDGPTVYDLIKELSQKSIEEALPSTLTICSGKEGRERKLYSLPKDSWKHLLRNKYAWHAKGENEKLELLWKRHQGVLMGLHPNTEGYFTKDKEGYECVEELPQLPDWILSGVLNKNVKLGKPAEQSTRIVGPGFAINAKISLERDIQLAQEATWALPPYAADDFDLWLTVGQSLHSLDDSLLSTWDEWSKQSEKYIKGECQKRWHTFSKEGGRGLGSLIHAAQENGWQPSQDHKILAPSNESLDFAEQLLNDMDLELNTVNLEKEDEISSVQLKKIPALAVALGQKVLPKEDRTAKNSPPNQLVDILLAIYKGNLLFSSAHNQFFMYEINSPGLWSSVTENKMKGEICVQLDLIKDKKLPRGYGINLINDIYHLLKTKNEFDEWNDCEDLLLFENGVLDVTTLKLMPHSRDHHLTQQQPYHYDSQATCQAIVHWLKETQDNDWGRVQVLRAWLRAVLLGRSDLQKFLELIGPGKSGKSSFATLAHALVGNENVTVSSLEYLEKNRFESANLYGKKLLLFNDVERYGGSVATLKAITGGDLIRNEHKFQADKLRPFRFNGQVVMTANEPLQTTDHTSGLARRRLTIPFNNPFKGSAKEQKVLIGVDSKNRAYGLFSSLLPGLVNWLLDMSEDDMREYLLETNKRVPFFKKFTTQQQLKSNPIKDWMDHSLIFELNQSSAIGFMKDAPQGSSHRYANTDRWLYANYAEFCRNSNNNIVGRKRFEDLFIDICQHQLNLNIYSFKNSRGIRIVNVAIRTADPRFESYPSIIDLGENKDLYRDFYGEIQLDSRKIKPEEND